VQGVDPTPNLGGSSHERPMGEDTQANRKLACYLKHRLQCLDDCRIEIESKLYDDERALIDKVDEGEYKATDPDVSRMLFHIGFVVANTIRYTMLVGVCTFLEEALKAVTKRRVPDYEARLRAQKKGNWLHKNIALLAASCHLDTRAYGAQLNKFHDMITIRNCIVHAWGNVSEARDPAALKAAVARTESASISEDGYVLLGDQVLAEAICAAEQIADRVLTSELRVSIT